MVLLRIFFIIIITLLLLLFVYYYYYSLEKERYAQFIPESIIDGRKRNIKFSSVDSITIAATLPHFWKDAGTKLFLMKLDS